MCLILIGILLTGFVAYLHHLWTKRAENKIELETKIAKRLKERDESVALAESVGLRLDERRRKFIGGLSFVQLRDELQSGTVSCLEALQTYYVKATEAHKKTNCATLFVKEAEEWAKAWDEKAKDLSFVKPKLFGIPISVKECISLKGYDTTRGFAQDLFKEAKKDSILIDHLKRLGCVPFVQTNVPQSLLTFNCCNTIYGITTHPLDKSRTPGGSTGGESAILGAGGSILGIGGDVGGSIRMPCHFTGQAGIKPSHLRFAHRGSPGAVPGRPLINANDGPMAGDIETIVEFSRAVWGDLFESEQDPYVPPVLWNEEQYSSMKPLRIGYYIDDGWFTPTPAVQRAVLEAKKHLEDAGHTVVLFNPPNHAKMFQMYIRAMSVDGGRYLRNRLMKDIIHPTLYPQIPMYFIPIMIQRLLVYPVSLFFPRLANILPSLTLSTAELRQTYAEIDEYRGEYVEKMQEQDLDAILSPPQVLVAPTHDIPCKLFSTCTYTTIYNLLDFGAGVVNVTEVTKEDEKNLIEKYPESDPWYKLAKNASLGSVKLPVGVQVAAPPYKEESVLRVLRDIEKAVRHH